MKNQLWTPHVIPKLAMLYGVYVVGSQAENYVLGLSPSDADWDLMVEYEHWRTVAMHIPKAARPNGNRGWRFRMGKLDIDIWPDTLGRYLHEATSPTRIRAKPGKAAYAVCLAKDLVIKAERSQ